MLKGDFGCIKAMIGRAWVLFECIQSVYFIRVRSAQ